MPFREVDWERRGASKDTFYGRVHVQLPEDTKPDCDDIDHVLEDESASVLRVGQHLQ